MGERGPNTGSQIHDVIVIGASAGGIEALQQLLSDLPSDLPAAVLVVLHMGESSFLPEVLSRHSALPVSAAKNGAPLQFGHVTVAAPGRHLLLHDHHILLRRGPRENLSRPAVDPLFRSAAATFGARVIGVILSGNLNDGTAGVRAVKQCGGLAVVQNPGDALAPGMPTSAIRHADVDHVVPAARMGALLARLVRQPAGATPPIPFRIRLETAIAAQEVATMTADDMLGEPSRFTCPECRGALWEIDDGSLLRYRCHIGHAFTADTLSAAQASQAEEILGTLLRAHRERAALTRRMAEDERCHNRGELAEQLAAKARDYEQDAELIRQLLYRQPDIESLAATEAGQ